MNSIPFNIEDIRNIKDYLDRKIALNKYYSWLKKERLKSRKEYYYSRNKATSENFKKRILAKKRIYIKKYIQIESVIYFNKKGEIKSYLTNVG